MCGGGCCSLFERPQELGSRPPHPKPTPEAAQATNEGNGRMDAPLSSTPDSLFLSDRGAIPDGFEMGKGFSHRAWWGYLGLWKPREFMGWVLRYPSGAGAGRPAYLQLSGLP